MTGPVGGVGLITPVRILNGRDGSAFGRKSYWSSRVREPVVACVPVCTDHGGGAGEAVGAGRDSDDQSASAGAGAAFWSGGGGNAEFGGLREVEGGRTGLHHVRYGCARSGVCAGSFAS